MLDLKVLISVICISASALSATANEYVNEKGEFKNPRDQRMIYFQLQNFVRECSFVSSYESQVMNDIDKVYARLNKSKKEKYLACYEESVPRMKSVRFLYDRLCRSLSVKGIPLEKRRLFSQFVAVTEYSDGISLMHIVLNDCLSKNQAPGMDIVKTKSFSDTTGSLIKNLNKMNSSLPFRANNKEIR